jgi:hypothetical protein
VLLLLLLKENPDEDVDESVLCADMEAILLMEAAAEAEKDSSRVEGMASLANSGVEGSALIGKSVREEDSVCGPRDPDAVDHDVGVSLFEDDEKIEDIAASVDGCNSGDA